MQQAQSRTLAAAGPDKGNSTFTSVNELFPALIRSRVSSAHESLVMIINRQAAYVPKAQRTSNAQIQQIENAARRYSVPGETVLRDIELNGLTHRLAIVDVRVEGDQADGVMVVASDITTQRADIFDSLRTFSLVSLGTILLAGIVGFVVTGRLLTPVKRLREATAAVTSDELTQRVPVPDSDDDISQLAANFNHMLDRLEEGFSDQRRFLDVTQTRALGLDELDRM
ncbi:HAMP domain-containing protein [Arthrobacter roseus]|uniref:HAMP domain-containing protein n=1 Tax=Arthrobacter roseus TaxID=136274 RepID=UPI00196396EE|nr:HAMP domain-containing protein [Arthrobacter roseus]MBM7849248.1 methyl-accepting chemotaxis protein [Arthrobacter roseus]